MRIIVIGCGKVGLALVEQLYSEGHEITVIDSDAARLKAALSNLDVMTLVGDGTSYTTLVSAGVERADVVIAVMDSDETNLLCCVIAKKASNCKTVARVRNPIYNGEIDFFKRELDLGLIFNPEMTSAEEIARLFNFPNALRIDVFSNRKIELVHYKIPADSKLVGTKLMSLRSDYHCNLLVATVTRNDEVIIPGGDFVIAENDILGVVASRSEIHEFFRTFGVGTKKVSDVLIVGGGKIGYYLANCLIDSGIHVKIVESRRDRCEFLSSEIPDADIIHGDGTDRDLLVEEGLMNTSGFAALTNIDEENILLSLFARRYAQKTITKINRINFDEVINQLDLDTIINPNTISTNLIIQYVRSLQYTMGSNIENFRKLSDQAEALEFVVHRNSEVVGIELAELKKKPNVLICCITRDRKIIIPGGQDKIEVGDRVVVIHNGSEIHNLDDIIG